MDRVTSRCVVLALLLLAGAGVDGATIRGVPSCTYWLQDREPGGHSSYFNAMWLVGYLSGAAVHSDKDVLRAVDSESIAVWMDNYCKANASRSVAEGGEALFNEVARRLPADKASNVSLASTSTGKPQSDEAPRPVPPSPSPSVADAPRAPMPAPSTAAADAPRPAMQSTSPAPAEPVPAPTRSPAPVSAEQPAPATPSTAPVKAAAKAPAESDVPPATEAHAIALNAPSYLPRALMLANTLPLANSKYQFKAEQFARANGCVRPAATMNIRTATSETFAVMCANGSALSVRCDPDCRDLQ